jgi:hypothetical protein
MASILIVIIVSVVEVNNIEKNSCIYGKGELLHGLSMRIGS